MKKISEIGDNEGESGRRSSNRVEDRADQGTTMGDAKGISKLGQDSRGIEDIEAVSKTQQWGVERKQLMGPESKGS